MKTNVLLVGTGRMARQYVPVLQVLGRTPVVVGRSLAGTKTFSEETGIEAHAGGLKAWKKRAETVPCDAIITVDADKLAQVAREAIAAGVRRILLEKPGGLTVAELETVSRAAAKTGAKVFIAYNRRFYASVKAARELIRHDGGPVSFSFIFNERLTQRETLRQLGISIAAQKRWFIANSTHVIDLAFYLGGWPEKLVGFAAAGPLWAPHPTLFTGAGTTRQRVPFDYHANWELSGPWSVRVGTKKRTVVLAPLEALKVEEDGAVREVPIDNSLDTTYKPGLFLQTKSFLEGTPDLPTLTEQIAHFRWYEQMERGTL